VKEQLRSEYEKYLGRYGLKPRPLPPKEEREAGQREVVRIMYEEAKARGDPLAEATRAAYEQSRERHLAETRHPATIEIEELAAEVEATIRAVPAFAERFHDDVFVGEFPTGSINCATVKVDGGFLVLVNSGTLMMLKQVVEFLCRGDADNPDSPASREAADGIAEVLISYIKDGDPYYGPKPLSGGMRLLLSSSLSSAAMKFVVAHEYGHILAGHLSEPCADSTVVETKVGSIEVLRKNHAQEFEADELGYRLTLGVDAYDKFDLKVIDAARDSNDFDVLIAATKQKCLIAAPFVPLTIDIILERFGDAMRLLGNETVSRDTHPPVADRIERLMAVHPGAYPRYSGFINIPLMLGSSIERMLKAMIDRVARKPETSPATESLLKRSKEQRQQIEDLKRCVEAIRNGDYSTAALVLVDAFERQSTILERDVDVVRRELVRAALGQKRDIRRALLDRHRDRRGVEQLFESARRDPLARMVGLSPSRPPPSLAQFAELVPNEAPNGFESVDAALQEARCRDSPEADLYLLQAVLSAWRGERDQVVSSFERALHAGIVDAEGRLARFIELEKRALELQVELDIQELLAAIAVKALGDKEVGCELAKLVKAYTEYLDIPLGPVAQRLVDVQLQYNH
jgi:hypothetical protein